MLSGGCYCREIRYEITAEPVVSAQCHCRPCQHFSGGGPNYFMLIPPESFSYTAGKAKAYSRPNLPNAVTREFCQSCGTQLITRRPGLKQIVLKAGTLDDPAVYGRPKMAIFCAEMAPFHLVPEGIPAFEGLPERR